jgi:hypothetical protein
MVLNLLSFKNDVLSFFDITRFPVLLELAAVSILISTNYSPFFVNGSLALRCGHIEYYLNRMNEIVVSIW